MLVLTGLHWVRNPAGELVLVGGFGGSFLVWFKGRKHHLQAHGQNFDFTYPRFRRRKVYPAEVRGRAEGGSFTRLIPTNLGRRRAEGERLEIANHLLPGNSDFVFGMDWCVV